MRRDSHQRVTLMLPHRIARQWLFVCRIALRKLKRLALEFVTHHHTKTNLTTHTRQPQNQSSSVHSHHCIWLLALLSKSSTGQLRGLKRVLCCFFLHSIHRDGLECAEELVWQAALRICVCWGTGSSVTSQQHAYSNPLALPNTQSRCRTRTWTAAATHRVHDPAALVQEGR